MKILVSDFDGTLFGDNFERNIEVVNKFVESGNIFILATGRNLGDLKKIIDDFDIKINYFICNDGAAIYDRFLNIIYRKDLKDVDTKKILNIVSNASDCDVFIDTTTGLTTNLKHSANRIAIRYKNKKNAIELLDKIKKEVMNVNGYLSCNWINITDKNISKGNAIDILSEYYNFNKDDIITVGNDINDMSMTKYNSVAIKGSPEEYVTQCKFVINEFSDILKNEKF